MSTSEIQLAVVDDSPQEFDTPRTTAPSSTDTPSEIPDNNGSGSTTSTPPVVEGESLAIATSSVPEIQPVVEDNSPREQHSPATLSPPAESQSDDHISGITATISPSALPPVVEGESLAIATSSVQEIQPVVEDNSPREQHSPATLSPPAESQSDDHISGITATISPSALPPVVEGDSLAIATSSVPEIQPVVEDNSPREQHSPATLSPPAESQSDDHISGITATISPSALPPVVEGESLAIATSSVPEIQPVVEDNSPREQHSPATLSPPAESQSDDHISGITATISPLALPPVVEGESLAIATSSVPEIQPVVEDNSPREQHSPATLSPPAESQSDDHISGITATISPSALPPVVEGESLAIATSSVPEIQPVVEDNSPREQHSPATLSPPAESQSDDHISGITATISPSALSPVVEGDSLTIVTSSVPEIQPVVEDNSPREQHSPAPLSPPAESQSDDHISGITATRSPSFLVTALRRTVAARREASSESPHLTNLIPHSVTAPSMAFIDESEHHEPAGPCRCSISVTRLSFFLPLLYLILGMVVYLPTSGHFNGIKTSPFVDAFYFSAVTLSSVGYGDIVPNSMATKIFCIVYVVLGVTFTSILLNWIVNHLIDFHEGHYLKSIKRRYRRNYIVDEREGRLKVRTKLVFSLLVVFVFIVVGVLFIHYVESLDWLDSVYLAVISVTTVGYGDQSFKSLFGRLFGTIWLLVSTIGVARAYLCLAELIVDKRNRKMARRILDRTLSIPQFLDADLDRSGSVSKSEFILHKLKEMGKLSEEDVRLLGQKFDQLDTVKRKTISLANLSGVNH